MIEIRIGPILTPTNLKFDADSESEIRITLKNPKKPQNKKSYIMYEYVYN